MAQLTFNDEKDVIQYVKEIYDSDVQETYYKDFEGNYLGPKIERERRAWQLLKEHKGKYDQNILRNIFDIADTFKGKKRWFGNLLAEPNKVHIFSSPIEELSEWIDSTLFSDLSDGDRFRTCFDIKFKGVGTGLPSLLLYLSEPDKYNVWIPATERGLEKLGRFKNDRNIPRSSNYLKFNAAAIDFRDTHGFRPQETDWALSFISKFLNTKIEDGHFIVSVNEDKGKKHSTKSVRSWSKPDGIPNLIGRKKVDQSLFKYGTHIPQAFHEEFRLANKGHLIESGNSQKVKLIIKDKSFDATIFNFNKGGSDTDTIHLRYDSNKELINILKTTFKTSCDYLQSEQSKRAEGDRTLINIPDEYAEYIDFLETGEPYQYRLETISSKALFTGFLAQPFSRIFKDRQEAIWAFDLLKETLDRLGISSPNDERFSLTLRHNGCVLRLNFGNWAILQFYGQDYSKYSVGMALIDDQFMMRDQYDHWRSFANSEPSISVYMLPIELVKPLEGAMRQVYENTFSQIATKFGSWEKTNYRKFNKEEIAEAVFVREKREKLFDAGLQEPESEWQPNIWWVNQGATLNAEKEAGILWAPIKSSDGKSLYHWEAMTEVQEGDIILHYANGALRYVSEVVESAIEANKPASLEGQSWNESGRLVKALYNKLDPEILLGKFSKDILNLNISQGPLDINGGVKQGYLFRLNAEALRIIQKAQPDTAWPEYAQVENDKYETRYWVFQGNPNIYDVVNALRAEKIKTWSVAAHKNRIKRGDKFILWVTGKNAGCYALGTITSDVYKRLDDSDEMQYYTDKSKNEEHDRCELTFDLAIPDAPIMKEDIIANSALKDLKVGLQGTNFSATKEQFDELWRIASAKEPHKVIINSTYTIEDLSNDTGIDMPDLERWLRAIERKKQAIIYGPPGTGKTFVAEKISRHLISETDGFGDLVQFHPAYSYEDFMQGIRPKAKENGQLDFILEPGRFLQFCKRANNSKGQCVLIIDEINRANLARVFGELMYLLEYRDRPIPLAAGGSFQIPDNVRIIGTMNTADRSIALVDHALRRRFAFLALYPNYDVLRQYHLRHTSINVELLIQVLKKLNNQIGDRHYEVGISYFLRKDLGKQVRDIWQMEIEPYLEEYFFDQPDKVDTYRWDKIGNDIGI